MKISGKHTIEELNGIRCSVIEKDASAGRADFVKRLLEHNRFNVQVQKNLPPPPKPAKPGEPVAEPVAVPETFKVGISDVTFILSQAIYSRKLRTLDNKILSANYWTQDSPEFADWYWTFKK